MKAGHLSLLRSGSMIWTIAITGGLVLCLVAVRLLGRQHRTKAVDALAKGFFAINTITVLILGAFGLLWLLAPERAMAMAPILQATAAASNTAMAAAVATGLAAVGAGIAVGLVGAAAVGAIAEKPEIFGRVLIFVGLAEGIAIYGLIISFIVLTGAFG
jgi:V/A-type H+-transporting ATPase subunit K